jgi:phosphate transport system protein
MTHLNTELQILKASITEMWGLVISQLEKANEAIDKADHSLIKDIKVNEKRVDAFELKINMDCENILALFNPLANDLRFVLAVLKINYNLERIGDYAHSIAKLVEETPFGKGALKETKVKDMFDVSIKMLNEARESFETENIKLLDNIFKKDEKLDKVNKNANSAIADLIRKKPEDIETMLNLLSVIRKLERVGDQTKNIGEEIIFYVEAKVLRHSKKHKLENEQKTKS